MPPREAVPKMKSSTSKRIWNQQPYNGPEGVVGIVVNTVRPGEEPLQTAYSFIVDACSLLNSNETERCLQLSNGRKLTISLKLEPMPSGSIPLKTSEP